MDAKIHIMQKYKLQTPVIYYPEKLTILGYNDIVDVVFCVIKCIK